jgi:hypothetical protein
MVTARQLRFSALCALFAPFTVFANWASPVPQSARETTFYSGTVRAQVRYKDWLPLLETNYRFENAAQGSSRVGGGQNLTAEAQQNFQQQPWHATLGSYFNLSPNLMVGGFYRYAQGERHRNDWVSAGWAAPTKWDWFWLNTNNRPEHAAIGDITWRQKLEFLPGENWVFELKNRLHYTWYSDSRYEERDNWGRHSANVAETKYVLRPGLQYFWLDGDKPFMTFFLQYEAHFALNFGTRTLVESWGYFGFFYHVSEEVAIGLNIARAQWWWSESDSLRNVRPAFGSTTPEMCSTDIGLAADTACNTMKYVVTQRALVVGITAMLRLDFSPVE